MSILKLRMANGQRPAPKVTKENDCLLCGDNAIKMPGAWPEECSCCAPKHTVPVQPRTQAQVGPKSHTANTKRKREERVTDVTQGQQQQDGATKRARPSDGTGVSSHPQKPSPNVIQPFCHDGWILDSREAILGYADALDAELQIDEITIAHQVSVIEGKDAKIATLQKKILHQAEHLRRLDQRNLDLVHENNSVREERNSTTKNLDQAAWTLRTIHEKNASHQQAQKEEHASHQQAQKEEHTSQMKKAREAFQKDLEAANIRAQTEETLKNRAETQLQEANQAREYLEQQLREAYQAGYKLNGELNFKSSQLGEARHRIRKVTATNGMVQSRNKRLKQKQAKQNRRHNDHLYHCKDSQMDCTYFGDDHNGRGSKFPGDVAGPIPPPNYEYCPGDDDLMGGAPDYFNFRPVQQNEAPKSPGNPFALDPLDPNLDGIR